MMGMFRDAIQEVIARSSGRNPERSPSRIEDLAARLQSRGGGEPKVGKNYDDIAKTVAECIDANEPLSAMHLRDAAWCLWETEPALATSEQRLQIYLTAVQAATRSSPRRSLAMSYLVSFDPSNPGIETVASALRELADLIGKPHDILHSRYSVFDPKAGPRNLGVAAVHERCSPAALLAADGLSVLGQTSAFAAASGKVALETMAEDSALAPAARLDLAKAIALKSETELSLAANGPSFANALCLPYAAGGLNDEEQDLYAETLVGLFGDPRTRPGNWVNMKTSAQVVEDWLTRQALRQFLDVVDDVALQRMWVYRRAFWEAVYKARLISSAWVVFDAHGASLARARFGKKVRFGQFNSSSGIQSGHTVMILRIGRGIVAEWSHNGRCHIWNNSDDSGAPALFRSRYSPDELRADYRRNPDFSQTHSSPDTYSWQRKVADKIYKMTGVRIKERDYRI